MNSFMTVSLTNAHFSEQIMLKVLSIPTHDSTGVWRKPEFIGVIIHA